MYVPKSNLNIITVVYDVWQIPRIKTKYKLKLIGLYISMQKINRVNDLYIINMDNYEYNTIWKHGRVKNINSSWEIMTIEKIQLSLNTLCNDSIMK